MTVVRTRDSLSTASNYLGDAVGELVSDDVPITTEQAAERKARVERHIRDAERSIERAKHRLGIEDGDRDE